MAKNRLNPLRSLVDWGKRLVLEAIARELGEQATEATGYEIEPPALEYEADVPAIEYVEAE
jgi:hypothetical protein